MQSDYLISLLIKYSSPKFHFKGNYSVRRCVRDCMMNIVLVKICYSQLYRVHFSMIKLIVVGYK